MILLKAGIVLEELEKEERQDMCEAIKAMIGEGKEIGKVKVKCSAVCKKFQLSKN